MNETCDERGKFVKNKKKLFATETIYKKKKIQDLKM